VLGVAIFFFVVSVIAAIWCETRARARVRVSLVLCACLSACTISSVRADTRAEYLRPLVHHNPRRPASKQVLRCVQEKETGRTGRCHWATAGHTPMGPTGTAAERLRDEGQHAGAGQPRAHEHPPATPARKAEPARPGRGARELFP
jgi:hypothetical protein